MFRGLHNVTLFILFIFWSGLAQAHGTGKIFLPMNPVSINVHAVLHEGDDEVHTSWTGFFEPGDQGELKLISPELKSTMRFMYEQQSPKSYEITFPGQKIVGDLDGQVPQIIKGLPFPVCFPAWAHWESENFTMEHELGSWKYRETIAQQVRVLSTDEIPTTLLKHARSTGRVYEVFLITSKETFYQLWQEGCPWPIYMSRDNFEAWLQ